MLTGFSACMATCFFMEYQSGEIIRVEIGDCREASRCSGRVEGVLTERGLIFLESQGLGISEVVTDASRTFIKMFGMLCVWHAATLLVK